MLITRAVTVRGVSILRLPDTIDISRLFSCAMNWWSNAATREGPARRQYMIKLMPVDCWIMLSP